jgi:hypothetical protein
MEINNILSLVALRIFLSSPSAQAHFWQNYALDSLHAAQNTK